MDMPVALLATDPIERGRLSGMLREAGVTAESHDSAFAFLAAYPSDRPAILLVDLQLPEMDGPALLQHLQLAEAPVWPIALADADDAAGVAAALRAGARDAVLRPVSRTVLLDAVARARAALSPAQPARAPRSRLTARERQCLELTAHGLTAGQAADRLGVTPATVNFHLQRAMAKLGVASKHQAVLAALANGLIRRT